MTRKKNNNYLKNLHNSRNKTLPTIPQPTAHSPQPTIPDTPECITSHMGLWACETSTLSQMFKAWQNSAIPTLSLSETEERRLKPLAIAQTDDGIAIVSISGVMQKPTSKFAGTTSTYKVRQALSALSADNQTSGVILNFDTPGGYAAGTNELAEAISSFNKPIAGYVEDMAASAGYWTASATDSIYINAPGKVGSIGTYAVVYDYSGAAKKDGIKVHVISTGDVKGAGVPGSEVTQEMLDEVQKSVDQTNEFFLSAVENGRNLTREQVNAIADGRMFIAADALELGLVDHIMSFEDALNHFRSTLNKNNGRHSSPQLSANNNNTQSNRTQHTVQRTPEQKESDNMDAKLLKHYSAILGAETVMANLDPEDGSFDFESAAESVISDLQSKVAEQSETIQTLKSQLSEQDDSIKSLENDLEQANHDAPLQPDQSTPEPKAQDEETETKSVSEQWDAAVQSNIDSGMSKVEAQNQAANDNPELYESYTKSFNQ